MYTILYWTFHVHGFVHDFMRVLWYCVILHDVTFALKALYFNGNDIVWHAMIKKLLVPVSPQGNSNSRKIKVLREFFLFFLKNEKQKSLR